MKKMTWFVLIVCAIAALSCKLPEYPAGSEGTTEGLIGGEQKPPTMIDYPPVALEPLTATLPADFIRGIDATNNYEIVQSGGVYRNADGTPGDVMQIMKSHGVNWVRLRIWNNPELAWQDEFTISGSTKYYPRTPGDGICDLITVRAMAKKAKAAGIKVLLDFHYSDNWADPGKQFLPRAWEQYAGDLDALEKALYDYTFNTIVELSAAGAEPDMVQIGNEIRNGMMTRTYESSTTIISNDATKLGRMLKAGSLAVRRAAPNAKIMLHLDAGGDDAVFRNWFDRYATHNGVAASNTEIDFDVIGHSWYPFYSSHKTLDMLYNCMRQSVERYGKEAVLVETSYAWTIDYEGDSMGNQFNYNNEAQALTIGFSSDNNGFIAASGIDFPLRNGAPIFAATPENQAKYLRLVMDVTAAAGGSGVFWWGGDWIPAPGLKSNWDNQTVFDFYGKPLPVLSVFGITNVEGPPPKPAGLRVNNSTLDTISLVWNTANPNAGVDVYALYRLDSAEGEWNLLADNLTVANYDDENLTPGTTYYYQLKAHNSFGWGNPGNALQAVTVAKTAPAGFIVTAVAADSITLNWQTLAHTTGYTIYHAGPLASTPNDGDYTALSGAENINFATTTFTHSGLSSGDTHWYKISAQFVDGHGEGPQSAAVSATAEAIILEQATISMATGTLDADFMAISKAAWSTDSITPTVTDTNNPNYDIAGLYVANDATNLYIAVDFGTNQPAAYEYDRIVVLIDNTSSSTGGVTNKVVATQTLQNGTIEAFAQRIFRDTRGGFTSTTGGVINASAAWTGGNSAPWLWKPPSPSNPTVIKFSIPLANIGVVSGDVIKVFAACSQGLSNGSNLSLGDFIPAAAVSSGGSPVTDVTIGGSAINTAAIDMNAALSFTVR
ncbi:MAG: glycosyl hydrolase 53 family protein [Treponema sp.]|jgi:arabinogalactan endo-1,4-beta-galactosidase|nr:glycosyl hydrolase 53 family protein [Treponema sp.]